MDQKKLYAPLAASFCLALAACGGGSGGSSGNNNAPAPGPAMTDTVLFSNSLVANSVTAVIDKAGNLRAFGMGNDQALTVGATPMAGNANTSSGNGWLVSGNTFVPATVSLSANSDGKSYTLAAQGSGVQASNAIMQPATDLVAPTLPALAGQYGMVSSWAIEIEGATFSGTYGYNCTISGTLSPAGKTVDLTNITFQTTASVLNPAGNLCPYAGKTYNGTGFLLGPSDAYPRGAFDIVFDDSASGAPTSVNMFNYIRQ